MKSLGRACLGILLAIILVLVALRVTGFEPKDARPGLWLTGELVTTPVTDWSFTEAHQTIAVQTREWFLPLLPHSVTGFCVTYNGQLYLGSLYRDGSQYPHGRHWNENVASEPRVRLKIGNQLYDRTLVYVTDAAERAGVIAQEAKKYPQLVVTPESFHVLRVAPGA